jgi:hypothetical protein
VSVLRCGLRGVMMFLPMNDQVGPAANSALTNDLAKDRRPRLASETILLALYSENGEIARTMVEWRHKLILLYVVALGALVTSGIWLREHNMRVSLRWELLAGSLVMCLFVLMEHRTTVILHSCYRVGSEIEQSLPVTMEPPIYSALHTTQTNLITYSNLLRFAYLITTLVLAVLAVFVSS